MDIQTRVVSAVTIFDLSGRLDSFTAPVFAQELEGDASVNGLVNLTNITFVDSTGLAVLVKGMKRHREKQGDLRLYGLQKPVRMIFEMTRLDKAFEILASEADGIQSFRA
jgi:anti-sigma B factor antagonist